MNWKRRLPMGAECLPEGGVHFRVWAPKHGQIHVDFEDDASQPIVLEREEDGWFAGVASRAGAGSLYRFRFDGQPERHPDPASRFQPEGPHGPSEVIDPGAFEWRHGDWRELAAPEARVLYELHVGTFTAEGTWRAAAGELPHLAELGINVIEVMPIADFAGRFGWGYDGVNLFAPTRLYGRPDDLRGFVDAAHALGIGVILDVVYNHFGPDGCYLREFSDDWFSRRYDNEWGDAINYDGPNSGPVREHFIANAACWMSEYRLDGLRLDATQQIFDGSARHVVQEIVSAARTAAGGRPAYVVCENEPQDARIARPADAGGIGADALWSDDFHHAALVALTGRSEAYYSDYAGTPQEFVSAARHGFLYQGQRSRWQDKPRGSPAFDLPPHAFVHYLENHDQVANSAYGQRLWQRTSPGRHRAMTALLLLGAQTPMLFQGQEFASSRPFLYFADHVPRLAASVKRGRADFLAQFPSIATTRMRERLPDPALRSTFERCKLDFAERDLHAAAYALHRDLLRLRRSDPVLSARRRTGLDGATLGPGAFVLRYRTGEPVDRLLVVNLAGDLRLDLMPEPLLAAPAGTDWRILWSSESPDYGGTGIVDLEDRGHWHLPGESALLLGSGHSE